MTLCRYSKDEQICTRIEHHEGEHLLAADTVAERFLALAAQFPVDPALLARIESHDSENLRIGHHFVVVGVTRNTDECTFREDGTDATYCGENEADHYSTGGERR